MGRPVLKVKGYTAERIKSKFRDDQRYTIGLRLYAVYQVALGQSSRKLEGLYNTSFKQITNWVHRFEKEGVEGLMDKPRSGRVPRLSQEQRTEIATLLSCDSPAKYNYNTATWTGPLLIDWIKNNYQIEFKKAHSYNIIKSLGFRYQKGRGIFPESDVIKQEEYKTAIKKLQEENPDTVLLFEDECSLSNTATLGYKWGKKGSQPMIEQKQRARERQTVFGSYNYGTGQMAVNFADRGNSKTFKKHLQKVLYEYRDYPKIIMVLDNVKYHHSKRIKSWLASQEKLELFFLPRYSPDLNAVERAWWYMRKKITHNRYVRSMKERKVLFWKMFSHFQVPNEELKLVCEINY